jgi:all-trans-8'-apo-beta-carotenal 15,15'-oxygenase
VWVLTIVISISITPTSGLKRQVWSAREEFSTLGEPVFVPRPGPDREEDDGWVIAQLYDCRRHQTQFVVLDAQNLSGGPIARVKLAHHTPYGFHGTFTPEVRPANTHTRHTAHAHSSTWA